MHTEELKKEPVKPTTTAENNNKTSPKAQPKAKAKPKAGEPAAGNNKPKAKAQNKPKAGAPAGGNNNPPANNKGGGVTQRSSTPTSAVPAATFSPQAGGNTEARAGNMVKMSDDMVNTMLGMIGDLTLAKGPLRQRTP